MSFIYFNFTKKKSVKVKNKIIIGAAATVAVGIGIGVAIAIIVRKQKQRVMRHQVAEEGYETAQDILFPLKSSRFGKRRFIPPYYGSKGMQSY